MYCQQMMKETSKKRGADRWRQGETGKSSETGGHLNQNQNHYLVLTERKLLQQVLITATHLRDRHVSQMDR